MKSASATHGALQQLASRGQDFTDNDLKEAMVSGLFSTARELPRLREISMVCGMGSETSCVALALLRCSSTEDMHCGRTVAGEIGHNRDRRTSDKSDRPLASQTGRRDSPSDFHFGHTGKNRSFLVHIFYGDLGEHLYKKRTPRTAGEGNAVGVAAGKDCCRGNNGDRQGADGWSIQQLRGIKILQFSRTTWNTGPGYRNELRPAASRRRKGESP
jgi:hypothetical protein